MLVLGSNHGLQMVQNLIIVEKGLLWPCKEEAEKNLAFSLFTWSGKHFAHFEILQNCSVILEINSDNWKLQTHVAAWQDD